MKNKHLILIAIVVILCPLFVNAIMLIPSRWACGDNPWIGFWGSYLGAILSASAAFLILFVQRKDNRKENEKNREANKKENNINRVLQLREITYRQETEWLNNLQKAVLENLSVYSPNSITSLIDYLLQNDFSQQDDEKVQNETKELLDKILMADTTVGMIVASNVTNNILQYDGLRNDMYEKTCGIICDIQVASVAFFCLNNNRRYNRSLLEKCYSKELSEILLQSETYETYIKLKEFVTSIRKKYYDLFESFRTASIECIVSENRRVKGELSAGIN